MKLRYYSVFAIVCLLAGSGVDLFAQGSLTPPGPPAPTMKSLDQVEARTPIDATHTPPSGANASSDDFTITAPGSYYLTGNLQLTQLNGIEVTAPNVTIDLNGFALSGSRHGGLGSGILIQSTSPAASYMVKHGSVTGFDVGIRLPQGVNTGLAPGVIDISVTNCGVGLNLETGDVSIANCRVTNNTFGIVIRADGPTIRDCIVSDNQSDGIEIPAVHDAGSVTGCTIRHNGGAGLSTGSPALVVSNCSITENAGATAGLVAGGPATSIINCNVSFNTAAGISAGQGSVITGCNVRSNGKDGILASNDCYIARNQCSANGTKAASAGIHTTSDGNRIVDNSLIFNLDTGLRVDGTASLITGNNSRFSTTNYNIAAGNVYGPIVDDTDSSAAPAVSGNSATGTINNNHPWANFAH
jgi:parallel beta-helix repeat protein